MTIMTSALWITLIGMGLVFIALILLWGLMELMMRLTGKAAAAEEAEIAAGECEPEETIPAVSDDGILQRRAAAAAVGVVLSLRPAGSGNVNQSSAETISAWQSVQRANQLNQRTSMNTRKQRGTRL